MTDLMQAIRDRRARAVEVRADYLIDYAGLQCWVVQHPTEDDRCYLVDMMSRRCTCPDWGCTAQGLSIDCKHIHAVEPEWVRLTGQIVPAFVRNGIPTHDAGSYTPAQVDADGADPFRTL